MPNTLHTPAIPDDDRIFNRPQADGTYRPLSEFFDREPGKDFDLLTMTRANVEEVFTMYRRLWGYAMPEDVHLEYIMQGEHLLDETQVGT